MFHSIDSRYRHTTRVVCKFIYAYYLQQCSRDPLFDTTLHDDPEYEVFAFDAVKNKRAERLESADMPEWIVRKAADIEAGRAGEAVEVLEEEVEEQDGDLQG